MKHVKVVERSDLISIFDRADDHLSKLSEKLNITVLGGASLILLNLRSRATLDIDIANTKNSELFHEICKKIGVNVDIITIASTVDLNHCPTIVAYKGKHLTINSVTPIDLIKLKLERFRKQDPEDIYAIIEHESISFNDFKSLVLEMVPDFIGNRNELLISAQIVVEQVFPSHIKELK